MMPRRESLSLCLAASIFVALSIQPALAVMLADSSADWSTTGTQGQANWFNGYYNLTTDGDATYAVGDFIAFQNLAGPGGGPVSVGGNHWTGTAWDLHTGFPGPWTEVGQQFVHPAGTNSSPNEEHWPIRRWVADLTEPTAVSLTWEMSKQNTAGGDGVGGKLFVNGVELDSATIAGTDGIGVVRKIYTTLQPGDVVDLALTPVLQDSSDGSLNRLAIAQEVPVLADSASDWSATGTQGDKNWSYGYYNFTTDGDATYAVGDFVPFQNLAGPGGGPVSVTGNHWTGTMWDLHTGFPGPWTELGPQTVHPAGTNSPPNEEHWAIRRWTADVTETTPVALKWDTRKVNPSGTGVTGMLFVNGVLVGSQTIAGNDTVGVQAVHYVNLSPGDVVDLALGPEGLTDRGDSSDGSANRLTVDPNLPPGPLYNTGPRLTDFQAGWSTTGTQGQNNWFYGYYDVRNDVTSGNGAYDPGDFIPFLNDGSGVVSTDPTIGGWKSSTNHWDGTQWDLLDQSAVFQGPWTMISQTGAHPAGNGQSDPEVHWAIRRWVSPLAGTVQILGAVHNTNPSGDGVVGRILVDGIEIWSGLSDGVAEPFNVYASVGLGSIIDLAIDPDGSGALDPANPATLNAISDTSDFAELRFIIFQAEEFLPFQPDAIPEPVTGTLLGLGVGLLALRARRRLPAIGRR